MEKKSMKMLFEDGMERRVPFALVLAILLEAATIVWWASAKERDVFFLNERVEKLEVVTTQQSSADQQVLDRLARIEERLSSQVRLLDEIERSLHH